MRTVKVNPVVIDKKKCLLLHKISIHKYINP